MARAAANSFRFACDRLGRTASRPSSTSSGPRRQVAAKTWMTAVRFAEVQQCTRTWRHLRSGLGMFDNAMGQATHAGISSPLW